MASSSRVFEEMQNQNKLIEAQQYLNDKEVVSNPLDFWRSRTEFKRLCILSRSILCATATTAGVERLFSVAGCILGNRRLSTTDKSFEMQLSCKVNSDLIPVVQRKRCYRLDY